MVWSPGTCCSSMTSAFMVSAGSCSVRFRSEEHTSELQSRGHLVCRLLLEKKKKFPSLSMLAVLLQVVMTPTRLKRSVYNVSIESRQAGSRIPPPTPTLTTWSSQHCRGCDR